MFSFAWLDKKYVLFFFLFVFLFFFFHTTQASIRETITYQAKIVDSNFIPPINGLYNFRFQVYDASTGGTLLWSEEYVGGDKLQIVNGVVNVELNSLCGNWRSGPCVSGSGVDFGLDSLYLEMQWDADGLGGTFEEVFLPRRRLTAVAYAHMSAGLITDLDIQFISGSNKSIVWNEANDRTLVIENTNANHVANVSIEGQLQMGHFINAPTALGDGVIYYNTTDDTIYARVNGVWKDMFASVGALTLDDAYNNFGAQASAVYIDAAQSQTGGLQFIGSLATDTTMTVSNDDDGGVLLVENTGLGFSFRVNDQSSDTSPFLIDSLGNVGIGTDNPLSNIHILDVSNALSHEFLRLDNSVALVSFFMGSQDPSLVATNATTGSLFLNSSTGDFFVKKDNGLTTNWHKGGLSNDLSGALLGTYGTPSLTNRFVTNDDPRLSQTTGFIGETALGTHLDYLDSLDMKKTRIYYTRVFFPENITINSIGVFFTESKSADINLGIYSDNNGPDDLLAQTGTYSVTTTAHDFLARNLTSPLHITLSGYYWIGGALSQDIKTRSIKTADDRFIPYRIQSKSDSSTVLPTSASPATTGNTVDVPYMAAFK